MLTKPAAVFVQLIGLLSGLLGLGVLAAQNSAGLVPLALGVGLVIWGGRATRERIRKETEQRK